MEHHKKDAEVRIKFDACLGTGRFLKHLLNSPLCVVLGALGSPAPAVHERSGRVSVLKIITHPSASLSL